MSTVTYVHESKRKKERELELVVEDGNEVKATFRLPKLLTKQLKVYAGMHEMSVTAVVIKACEEFMDRDKVFKEKFRLHIT